jgi:predicted ester cyclase
VCADALDAPAVARFARVFTSSTQNQFYKDFWKSFPGSQLIFEDVITSGDKVVCRFVIEATYGGPFRALPATGKRVSMAGITILRFSEGACVERWSQADSLGLLTKSTDADHTSSVARRGVNRVARRAGTNPAAAATSVINNDVAASTSGSADPWRTTN